MEILPTRNSLALIKYKNDLKMNMEKNNQRKFELRKKWALAG